MASAPALPPLLRQRLILCLGSGGVGKTTVAAALAYAAAAAGRRSAVITVDPARRLRDALGLAALTPDPRRVDVPGLRGELHAMALDPKRAFDALIERVAPDPSTAQRIRDNRVYQALSAEVGGSTEYMAMEKLHELLAAGTYDCVVVDTAPGAHARDLLGAPGRIASVAASSAVRILKTPASILAGAGLAATPLRVLLTALERWSGMTLLQDLSDFAAGFEPLSDGFGQRAAAITNALRAAVTSFVLVASPESDTAAATAEMAAELRAEALPLAGVIVNRVHDFPPRAAAGKLPPCSAALARKLEANYRDYAALAQRDRESSLRMARDAQLLATLPVLEEPVTNLAELRRLAELLQDRLGGSGAG